MFKKLRKFLIAAGVALSAATFLSAASNVSFATNYIPIYDNRPLFTIRSVKPEECAILKTENATGEKDFIHQLQKPVYYDIGFKRSEDIHINAYDENVTLKAVNPDIYSFGIIVGGTLISNLPEGTLFNVVVCKKDQSGETVDRKYIFNVPFVNNLKSMICFDVDRFFMTDGTYDIFIFSGNSNSTATSLQLRNIEISSNEIEKIYK